METENNLSVLYASLPEMPAQVLHLLALFPAEDLTWKPDSWEGNPGENFSAIEQICHLRDIEIDGYHKRIAAIRETDEPLLSSIDGYTLSVERDYAHTNLMDAWQAFANARLTTISILENLNEAAWERAGDFHGRVNLRGLIHFLCSHDMEHLASLRWLLGKLEGRITEKDLENSF